METIEQHVGREKELVVRVGADESADAYGNEGLMALATPALVGLFERAAMGVLEGLLGSGKRTVGGRVEVTHLAPTPTGFEVTVSARIVAAEPAKVTFALSASDQHETIAEGRHTRFVVDSRRFQERLEAKASA